MGKSDHNLWSLAEAQGKLLHDCIGIGSIMRSSLNKCQSRIFGQIGGQVTARPTIYDRRLGYRGVGRGSGVGRGRGATERTTSN